MFLILLNLFFAVQVNAQTDDCWKKEINPATKKVYTSAADWNKDVSYWETKEPEGVSLDKLFKAYEVYKKEKAKAQKIGTDKAAHCYMGCKIAAETNLETATYVGWKKEDDDINDCKVSTHYEETDFDATVFGGRIESKNPQDCEFICKKQWGKKRRK